MSMDGERRQWCMAGALASGLWGAGEAWGAVARMGAAQPPAMPAGRALASVAWLGYGPWALGRAAQGGARWEDRVMATDAARDEALRSGQVQGASMGAHAALALIVAGVPVRVVLLEDISLSADALLARPLAQGGPRSVRDLGGRRVAFEPGSTSHLLLAHVLGQQGLSLADVVPLHRTAQEAAQALRRGECDAAVTYEPHLAELRQRLPGLRRLATAAGTPGLISDVLVLRTDFMAAEPDAAAAWLRTWSLGVQVYRRSPQRARAQIARQMQVPLAELQAGFEGICFFDLQDNRPGLGGWFRHRTLPRILAAGQASGLIGPGVSLDEVLDLGPMRLAWQGQNAG